MGFEQHRPGDKVRIKLGPDLGQRGIVKQARTDALAVSIEGRDVVVGFDAVTNYSLAARRAWSTMPKRAGRPRLAIPRKRMISLRIDVDVLDALSILAEQGAIASREQAINDWLRARANELLSPSAPDHIRDRKPG